MNSVIASAALSIFNVTQKNSVDETDNNELIILEKIIPKNGNSQ